MHRCRILSLVGVCILSAGAVQAQGPVEPAEAPGPVMKSLEQIESRTLIASLPYQVLVPGSYYLTTNLMAGAGESGITVLADHVTIDLNGFALAGSGLDSGTGIYQGPEYDHLTVCDGALIHWRGENQAGLNAQGAGNSIHDLQAVSNRQGILVGRSAVLRDCAAMGNLSFGFDVGSAVVLERCVAGDNGLDGLRVIVECVLSECSSTYNGGYGINIGSGSTVSKCMASHNALDGITSGGLNNAILHCTASFNARNGIFAGSGGLVSDCVAGNNTSNGIQAFAQSMIRGNVCKENGAYDAYAAGIHAIGTGNRLEGNHAAGNGYGFKVDGVANLLIRNSAAGNGTNYHIEANNKVGVIVAAPDSEAISGDTGGAGVGSIDPWSNLSL